MAGVDASWDKLRNVINLGPLVNGGYCEAGHLNCPGVGDRVHADSSYSYQWQAPGLHPGWGAGSRTTLVLGDRNPIIDAYRAGRPARAMSISVNHGGRGQNALSNDGSSLWLVEPLIGRRDNIWLPAGLTTLRAGARPAAADDVFLAH